jgi:L-cysteine:1D-myo-inositol 2-amino-2-deoxy-alpha-D-glucopyranoside ligase
VGLVGLDGIKMSKSLGNLVFVGELLKEYEPMAVRLALLSHHYRGDWEWHSSDMDVAAARLERWRSVEGTEDHESLEAVRRSLDEDLDAPGALESLDALVARDRPVAAGAALLGVAL